MARSRVELFEQIQARTGRPEDVVSGSWRSGIMCTGGRCGEAVRWPARCRRRGARQKPAARRPALGPYTQVIDEWLVAGSGEEPRKQRHTARRVWRRLVAEHGATVAWR